MMITRWTGDPTRIQGYRTTHDPTAAPALAPAIEQPVNLVDLPWRPFIPFMMPVQYAPEPRGGGMRIGGKGKTHFRAAEGFRIGSVTHARFVCAPWIAPVSCGGIAIGGSEAMTSYYDDGFALRADEVFLMSVAA